MTQNILYSHIRDHYIVNIEAGLTTLQPDKTLYTGYKKIDAICPITASENTIVTGRTGRGKTVLGVNIINGLLRNNNDVKIIVFSIELSKKAFLRRLIASEYNIPHYLIKNVAFDNANQHIINVENYIKNYQSQIMIIDDIYFIEDARKFMFRRLFHN